MAKRSPPEGTFRTAPRRPEVFTITVRRVRFPSPAHWRGAGPGDKVIGGVVISGVVIHNGVGQGARVDTAPQPACILDHCAVDKAAEGCAASRALRPRNRR